MESFIGITDFILIRTRSIGGAPWVHLKPVACGRVTKLNIF